MNGVDLTLVVLGATLPLATLGLVAGLLTERITTAPGLRERIWTLAFLLPALAAFTVPLLAPQLTRLPRMTPPVAGTARIDASQTLASVSAPDPLASLLDLTRLLAPTLLLSAILLGTLVALALLIRRHFRLVQLVRRARRLEDAALTVALERQAQTLKVRTPLLKASETASSPLLAGLLRPAIVIPDALTALPTERLALICGHELAHLKRADNPRSWVESTLLAVLWFNPLMTMIHARLADAREERCDAIALAHASDAARRAYAESLIQTLRLRAGPEPHSAFIGAGRKTAMRLKAILKPGQPAGRKAVAGIIGIGAALTLMVGAGSVALAMQAAPEANGRHSVWTTSSQETALSPKGELTIAADMVEERPGGVTVWRGRPIFKLRAATGNPAKDAALAKVTFLVNGHAVKDDFTPASLSPAKIALIEVTKPQEDGDTTATVNFVMLAPPAPPAPLPPLAPMQAAPPPPLPPMPPLSVNEHAPPMPPMPRLAAVAPTAPPAQPREPAPPPAPPAPPVWEALPSGADVAAAYPAAAAEKGLSGRAIVSCRTTPAGALTGCVVDSETPAGNGFGDAALKLTTKFKLQPRGPNGEAVGGGFVRIPIDFRMTTPDAGFRPAR